MKRGKLTVGVIPVLLMTLSPTFLKKIYLKKKMKDLEVKISNAEKNSDNAKAKQLMEELKVLSEEHNELN